MTSRGPPANRAPDGLGTRSYGTALATPSRLGYTAEQQSRILTLPRTYAPGCAGVLTEG